MEVLGDISMESLEPEDLQDYGQRADGLTRRQSTKYGTA